MSGLLIEPIAYIRNSFDGKFGIPRQAGLVEELDASIFFEPKYRNPDALRGLEGFSHIWLIWHFSEARQTDWSPTVRPPRLGGNRRVGVFATRSPFRPNPLGLSCVRLLEIGQTERSGPVLRVGGADLLDGTPIFDIKPYIPYADCRREASSGFAPDEGARLRVMIPERFRYLFLPKQLDALIGVLSCDPRPSYHDDPERVYGMRYGSREIKFTVSGDTLTVTDIE